jgi:hypothetical protein
MAKRPKGGLSDEDILSLRDDVAHPDRAQSLAVPGARRALAESRLRALAIALSGKGASQHHVDVPQDDELLEYLLADMPEDRHRELESQLRGNPRAFERLVKLHELTSSHVNHRDLQHADMAERSIKRHDLGKFEVMLRAGRLAFRLMDERSSSISGDSLKSAFALEMPEPLAYADEELEDEETLGRIERLLSRCSRLVTQVRALRNGDQARDSEEFGNPNLIEERYVPRRVPSVEEELSESVRQLQELAHTLEREAMFARKMGSSPKFSSRRTSSVAEFRAPPPASRMIFASRMAAHKSERDGDWQKKIDLAAGPWTLSLAGHSGSASLLEISVVATESAAPVAWPFVTIVQPGKTFVTSAFDAHGYAELPLIAPQNVLMLQAAEVWSVHLNFSVVE